MNIETKSGDAPRVPIGPSSASRSTHSISSQTTMVFISVVLLTIVWVGVLIYFGLEVVRRFTG